MPELPEVETIRRWLRQGRADQAGLLGAEIREAEVVWPRTLAMPALPEFRRRVVGQRIVEIGRRGKFLLLQLSADWLIFHLRMSGDLRVEAQKAPRQTHDRAIFELADGRRLVFNDARKFGRLWLTAEPKAVLGSLGPEPFDERFTPEWLRDGLQQKRRQLKALLLDQSFLAGLGNIYTDEALFLAGLHPCLPSQQVDAAGAMRLWQAIRQVLQEGIEHHGASIDWVYRGGDFQNYFRVYRRAGQPCPRCGAPIQRLRIGQRGTHFCPRCQALPERGGTW